MLVNNKNFFEFKPNDLPILLYGKNFFAEQMYRCLQKAGYNVKGFVDRKYSDTYEEGAIIKISLDSIGMLEGGVKIIS